MEFANLGCLCKKIHFGSRWANISFVFSAAFFNKSFKKVQEWIKIFYDWWWGYLDMDLVSVQTVSELLGVLLLSLIFESGPGGW